MGKADKEMTHFGNTIKYPNQKPEDVFSVAELEGWAMRNGWKRMVEVERWTIPEGVRE